MKTRVLFYSIFLFGIITTLQAKNYIVCIGVGDYPDNDIDLNYTADDARTIHDIYKANGHSELFLAINERATVENVRAAMNAMFSKAGNNDGILFFFSGHGSPNSFLCYDGHLRHDELVEIMSHSKAGTKMVMANACHSGQVSQAQRELRNARKKYNKNTIMFFLSSRGNEYSWGASDGKNSYFTSFLARGLRGAADANKDSIVSAREIYLFVRKGLSKQTYTYNGVIQNDIQHPVMWGKFDNNMPVISWKRNN